MPSKPNLKNNRRVTDFFKPVARATDTDASTSTSAMQITPPPPRAATPSSYTASDQLRHEDSASNSGLVPPSSPLSSICGSQTSAKPRVIPSSDGEESPEDSDLEDPFAASAMRAAATPAPKPRPNLGKCGVIETPLLPPGPTPVELKFSLQKLLEDKKKASAIEDQLKRARDLVNAAENKQKNLSNPRAVFTQDTADRVMGEHGSGTHLLAALDRADAWRVDEIWDFFDSPNHIDQNKQPFPTSAVKGHGTFAGMEDTSAREQLFLSGVFTDMGAFGEALPDKVLIWMLDQVCLEPRDDLVFGYFQLLRAQLSKRQDILTLSKISSLLELLGAKKDALNLDCQLSLRPRDNATTTSPGSGGKGDKHWNIKLLLELLGTVMNAEDEERTQFICGILVRIALDDGISRAGDVLITIEQSLGNILCNISEDKWGKLSQNIGCAMLSTILQPQLRIRVLRVLPITSPQLHLFRRRLACAFLFDDGSYMTRRYDELVKLSRFSSLLRESRYKIQKNTDYAALQSFMSILDIAIDNGATLGTTAEKDKEVDQLVDILSVIFSRIVDTNAQNLARTEAKDTIERLQFRLTFAVRSKQRMALDMDHGDAQGMLAWVESATS